MWSPRSPLRKAVPVTGHAPENVTRTVASTTLTIDQIYATGGRVVFNQLLHTNIPQSLSMVEHVPRQAKNVVRALHLVTERLLPYIKDFEPRAELLHEASMDRAQQDYYRRLSLGETDAIDELQRQANNAADNRFLSFGVYPELTVALDVQARAESSHPMRGEVSGAISTYFAISWLALQLRPLEGAAEPIHHVSS